MIHVRGFLVMVFVLFAGVAQAAPASLYDVPMTFRNPEGQQFRLAELKGGPVIMTMTYTSCQFACPRILQRMKNLEKAYRDRGLKARYVVVSFDPKRDTPKRLNEVQKHDSGTSQWLFLTGAESVTRQLSMILGIRYERNPDDGSISHDNKIVILDANGTIEKELNGLSSDVSEAFSSKS